MTRCYSPALHINRIQPPAGELPLLAILVVNYGSHELLQEHLANLMDATPEAVVVVVDNFTSEIERWAITELAAMHNWHLVTPEGNVGFGAGINMAAAKAQTLGAQQILLLNPDVVLHPHGLTLLRREVTEHPEAMHTPMIVRPDGFSFCGAVLDLESGKSLLPTCSTELSGQEQPSHMQPWLSGACLLLDIRLWIACGGFDDEYFLYWEDVDLSHRILKIGGELRVTTDVNVMHFEGSTSRSQQTSARAKSDTYYYYNIRNRLLYAHKHLSAGRKLRWAMLSPFAARDVLLQGGRRQFLHSLRPVGTATRATFDGLLLMIGLRRAGIRRGRGCEAPSTITR